jgi:hypothetical protein
LANHLEIHIENLSALALEGVQARNYRKDPESAQAQDLQLKGSLNLVKHELRSNTALAIIVPNGIHITYEDLYSFRANTLRGQWERGRGRGFGGKCARRLHGRPLLGHSAFH